MPHHIEPDSVAEIERAGACALGLRVISYGEWEVSEIAKKMTYANPYTC